jgi:hypothetical protein
MLVHLAPEPSMDASTRRELRRVRAILLTATIGGAVLAVAAFRQPSRKRRFTEIDVERINVVEKDGKLRLTISNSARLPDPVIGGKSYPLRGGTGAGSAGMIFFNDEGNENGGLVFAGRETAGGHRASGHLTFDQFDQDEALALSYTDVDGHRRVGLTITDRANVPIQAFAESALVIRRLPDGPEKTRRLQQLRAMPGAQSATRVFAGRTPDQASLLVLADTAGRPRLRLTVDSLGAPSLEFLDESGRSIRRYPPGAR